MKKLFLICLIAFASLTVSAQYKWGIGVALNGSSVPGGGISLKTFASDRIGYDFTIGLGQYFFDVTGLYEIHAPLADNLKWYYGPGAHIGTWHGGKYGNQVFLGLDGTLGLELKPNIPFAFSFDFRPRLDFIGNEWGGKNHWFWWGGQLGIRYTFGK
jgi:hypothetical protein